MPEKVKKPANPTTNLCSHLREKVLKNVKDAKLAWLRLLSKNVLKSVSQISSHLSLNISRVFVLTSLATAIYSLVYN